MRGEIALIITVVVACAASEVLAVGDKAFTSSGQILAGEEWDSVSIYNDDTVVDMLGGTVDSIGTYDASTLKVFAGYVSTLDALEYSTVNISAGFVYGLVVSNQAVASFSDAADLFAPRARHFGTINMTGGTVDHLGAIDSGTINLYGGIIADYLVALDSAAVNIYGHDLLKTASGGAYGYGQASGFWLNDTTFTIDLNDAETYDHINLIPEPSSLALLALGSLLLRRRR
ncbi:MAG: PEP-CTERM sorting domain-containing protein [Planctomycetota bacterium]